MPKKLKYYVSFVIGLGLLFFLYTLTKIDTIDYKQFIFFLLLSIAAESLTIEAPNDRGLSVGFAIGLTLILIMGMPQASWISSLGIMFRIAKKDDKYHHILNTPIYKTLFNGSNIILSSGLACVAYEAAGGISGKFEISNILPMVLGIAVYIMVNNLLTTFLMSILTEEKPSRLFKNNVFWVIRDNLALAPLAIIIGIAYFNYGIFGVLLFFGPLLLARYSFKMYIDMKNIYVDTVKALCTAVEAKDPYTEGHSKRTCDLSYKLGKRMGLSGKSLENLRIAAMLHDIGKIGIDERILNKPGSLTKEEFNKIKEHPVIGANIISEIDFLKDVANIVLSHHERYDGTGYPNNKTYREIPIESSIICIVDVFDALTSDRPYRKAMSFEKSIKIIEDETGFFFEPKLAGEFVKMMWEEKRMLKVVS